MTVNDSPMTIPDHPNPLSNKGRDDHDDDDGLLQSEYERRKKKREQLRI
jgi:hypothetical protein